MVSHAHSGGSASDGFRRGIDTDRVCSQEIRDETQLRARTRARMAAEKREKRRKLDQLARAAPPPTLCENRFSARQSEKERTEAAF